MSTSWMSWARELAGISLTAKLIAYELAVLADTRGVAIVPLDHLEGVTSRSRRTVQSALEQLEAEGHLRWTESAGKPFRGVRLQLVRRAAQRGYQPRRATPARASEEPGSAADTNEALRERLQRALASGWKGKPCWDLAATLDQQGAQRFSSVIARRRITGAETDHWDTLTLAWEVAQTHAKALVKAAEPWALWVHLVRLECSRRDRDGLVRAGIDVDSLAVDTGSHTTPGAEEASQQVDLGIDDFGVDLTHVVETLVGAGMTEAVAWAGTARVLELAGAGPSRRHWLAARDAKLQALGINDQAARCWMSLLVGSRRGREGFLSSGDEAQLRQGAAALASAL